MLLRTIPLKDLAVNSANDRHGELPDEYAAIDWLLTHRAPHMRNLAKDIAVSGGIYEPPLVHKVGSKFVVYDGNRRVTCLKLLSAPEKAPSKEWAAYFDALRRSSNGVVPGQIECQVEQDRDRLDEILYRRHTGGQGGVGQSQWDAEAKSNFIRRTGKKTRINIGEEIEKILHEAGILKTSLKLPRSNLNRLLSAEGFRNRVGMTVSKNKIEFTHDPTKALGALNRIAHDLITKKITLDQIWDNKDKRKYLDLLERQKVLPTAADTLSSPQRLESNPTTRVKPTPNPLKEEMRQTLIRNMDYGLVPALHVRRAHDIWNELQHRLKFGEHDNAIAVLFRVLLEFSTENYISRIGVAGVYANDKLSKKFIKVLDHMVASGTMDAKAISVLKKFEHQEPILSANTLNAYVHHKDFFPSDHHLKSMWDSLSEYVVICLKA